MVGGRHIFLALCATAFASEAGAAPPSATAVVPVRASVVRPLMLSASQDLDLGTIVLRSGTWSGATVSVSQAGILTCASPNLICSGATQAAIYRVTGTNKMIVQISAPNVTLTKQGDSSKTLQLVPLKPASVTLPNSGNHGVEFQIGGTITLSSTTADGSYAGTINVTVDYQ
jgi:Domain of unknown function (DUF4402)